MKRGSGYFLFIMYLVILVWILLFKFSTSFSDVTAQIANQPRRFNIIPFGDSLQINQKIDITEMIQNMFIFVPFGGLLGMVAKKSSVVKKISYILLFSVTIEVCQFIFRLGATDITDVITNLSGGLLGMLIYGLLLSVIPEDKLDRVLLIIGSILFTLSVLGLATLLLLNQ